VQEILSFAFVLPEKRLIRDTKLIAILRRQFCIILTALEENIFSLRYWAPSLRDSAQYIFFQLAVNIMQNCRLKIAFNLYYLCNTLYYLDSFTQGGITGLWCGGVTRIQTVVFIHWNSPYTNLPNEELTGTRCGNKCFDLMSTDHGRKIHL